MQRIIFAVAVSSGLALAASSAWAADPFKHCADQMRAMKPQTSDQDQARRATFMSCMGLKAPVPAKAMARMNLKAKPGDQADAAPVAAPAIPAPRVVNTFAPGAGPVQATTSVPLTR